MDAKGQCRLYTWRRTLHVYMVYILYMVTTIGQCKSGSNVASVVSPAPSRPVYTTANPTQVETQTNRCKPSCQIQDFEQRNLCLDGSQSCRGNRSCNYSPYCIQCNYFRTNVSLVITRNTDCDSYANDDDNSLMCDPMNDKSLQFVKPGTLTWREIFSQSQFAIDVSCSSALTCSCCDTKDCPQPCQKWICTLKLLASPTPITTSITATGKTPSTTPSTSTMSISTPSTSTMSTSTPSTSTMSTPTTSTSTMKEMPFASQTDSDHVPTIAALGSMLVISLVVIGIIVLVVLRRSRRRKQEENPEFIINNTAYGDVTLHHKNHNTHPGPDHAEITVKPEVFDDEEHTYNYASFDDSNQTLDNKPKHLNCYDPKNALTPPDDSYLVLEKESHQGDYELTQAAMGEHLGEEEIEHLEHLVLDKRTNDSDVAKHTDSGSEVNNETGMQTVPNVVTGGTAAKSGANGTGITKLAHDPYDHVRVGHAQTNGFDDGVYDELKKQHVRYEPEEVDNDYDHC